MIGMFMISPAQSYKKWVVYTHRSPRRVQWVGFCEFAKFANYPDARRDIRWLNTLQHGNSIFAVIEKICVDQDEAQFEANQLIKLHNPICNREREIAPGYAKGAIICDQNGVEYANASAAARALNLSPSSLSQHLKGTSGYRSVIGLTFRRVHGGG